MKVVSQGKASKMVYLLIALKVICWFYFLFCTAKAKSDSSLHASVVYTMLLPHIFPLSVSFPFFSTLSSALLSLLVLSGTCPILRSLESGIFFGTQTLGVGMLSWSFGEDNDPGLFLLYSDSHGSVGLYPLDPLCLSILLDVFPHCVFFLCIFQFSDERDSYL